ncbi:MAG: hypothetical protein JXX28_11085 [Deltaproteobacteria bacterium]|nr:hypothetical protein [Deltaproteobacteria bacterium]
MTRIATLALTALLSLAAAPSAQAAVSRADIDRASYTGALTGYERGALLDQLERFRHAERRALRDRYLDRWERRELHELGIRLDRSFFELTHNRERIHSGYPHGPQHQRPEAPSYAHSHGSADHHGQGSGRDANRGQDAGRDSDRGQGPGRDTDQGHQRAR